MGGLKAGRLPELSATNDRSPPKAVTDMACYAASVAYGNAAIRPGEFLDAVILAQFGEIDLNALSG